MQLYPIHISEKKNLILDKECTSSDQVQVNCKDEGKRKAVEQLYLIVLDSKIQSFHFKVFSTVVLHLEQVLSKLITIYQDSAKQTGANNKENHI